MRGSCRRSPATRTITYHDSCYLARHNDVLEAPRELVGRIGRPLEMARSGKRTFCCGAGGAHMWMEERGSQINEERAREAAATGAETLAVACPFCTVMLDDGVRQTGGDLRVADVSTLLVEALGDKDYDPAQRCGHALAELEDAFVQARPVVLEVDDEAVAPSTDVLRQSFDRPFGRACDRMAAAFVAACPRLGTERNSDAQHHPAVRTPPAQLCRHGTELVGRKRDRMPNSCACGTPQRRLRHAGHPQLVDHRDERAPGRASSPPRRTAPRRSHVRASARTLSSPDRATHRADVRGD